MTLRDLIDTMSRTHANTIRSNGEWTYIIWAGPCAVTREGGT